MLPSTRDDRSSEQAFLRGFGPLITRTQGGSRYWSHEEFYYGAKGFLSFDDDFTSSTLLPGVRVEFAKRRFFFDGHSTGRLEVLFRLTKTPDFNEKPSAWRIACSLLELRVACGGGAKRGPLRLAQSGHALAEHFAYQTAPSAQNEASVLAGHPFVLLENTGVTWDELDKQIYPSGLGISDYRYLSPAVRAAPLNRMGGTLRTAIGNGSVILLMPRLGGRRSNEKTYGSEQHYRARLYREARSARVHLIRYHAERETLRLALSAMRARQVEDVDFSTATATAQKFLSAKLRHLKKSSEDYRGRSTDLPRAYAATVDLVNETELSTLLEGVRDLQATLADAVERRIDRDLHLSGRRIVENSHGKKVVIKVSDRRKIIELGQGVVVEGSVVVANKIQSSFNSVDLRYSNPKLNDALGELHRLVAELTTGLSDDQAELAAQDLIEIVGEIERPQPRPSFVRRAAESLVALSAATALANPIVDTVTKILTLLGLA
jgi:hypothetical protein